VGTDDRIKNTAQQAKGQIKETAGKVTNNEDLEVEGQGEQAEADVKQTGEDVKDAAREADPLR
jgi:uncharacterized protein YjbJ (UPF0337 family)